MPTLELSYHAAGPSTAPAVLVLPGGGYTMHAAHEAEPVAAWLNGLGLHVAVLRYTVGAGCFPAALHDARAALRALREGRTGMPVDATRIGVLGFSAGGHLASLLATDAADVPGADPDTFAGRPDAAVLCYAVTDLRDQLVDGTANGRISSGRNLLPGADGALLTALSSCLRIDDATPPCFIWTTGDDEVVPAAHSVQFAAAAGRAGVPYALHVFPHGRHGLGLLDEVPAVTAWPTLCAQWLTDLGWTAERRSS